MKIEQTKWMPESGWAPAPEAARAQLVLVFGATAHLKNSGLTGEIRRLYPAAQLFGCSTAGEICGTQVFDDSVVATAVTFESTQIRGIEVGLSDAADSFRAGERLAQALSPELTESGRTEKLAHVLVLSDGLNVNGSELVRGLTGHLPDGITVTGGLAGDGARFEETLVIGDGAARSGSVAVLGLYGDRLRVGFGSLGGWDPFGPERLITRSKGNVLYEMDGRSALGLYKRYLGDHAKDLPAAGLLFPLSLRTKAGDTAVVRTILAINEAEESLTFAGDVPQGAYARLMKANFDRLIDGATGAAKTSRQALGPVSPELAILISCVGRKLLLKQRIEEEVEGVRDALGNGAVLSGFYSYGEISPFVPGAKCELHNQTMTITTFSEV